jgi:hypothetical protein
VRQGLFKFRRVLQHLFNAVITGQSRAVGVYRRREMEVPQSETQRSALKDVNDMEPCICKIRRAYMNVVTAGPRGEGRLAGPTNSSSAFTMAFKLHGYPKSTCTRRVALVARERNIPYELIPVSVQTGEHTQEAHLSHHPFGQVPYIVVRHLSSHPLSCRHLMPLAHASSSMTTASSCSSRALSAATLRRSGLAQS